ncbi:MAG: PDZ domain-containing protein [Planctomycetia bacterium]|nr:PDZ domain-containing protein [Planctomycetia bacterium]
MTAIRPVDLLPWMGWLAFCLLTAPAGAQEPPQPKVDVRFEKQPEFSTVVLDTGFIDASPWLGAETAPADDALRSQLALPGGQGLVVRSVEVGSPAEKAGLEPHDVILTVGGEPVATPEALRQQIADKADKAVPVVVLRGGKRITIEVTPKRAREWEVEVFHGGKFWIGVTAAEADETLRAQLRLKEKCGLVVTAVEPDSPAGKAGIKPHDLLLEFGGKPLATVEDLQSQVNEVGEKPANMKLLRGGETMTIEITPAARSLRFNSIVELREVHDSIRFDVVGVPLLGELKIENQAPKDVNQQLAELTELVKKLTEKIDSLERAVKAPAAPSKE